LIVAAACLLFGAVRQELPFILWAEFLLALVAGAYLMSVTKMWAVERGELELSLHHADGASPQRDEEIPLSLEFANRSGLGFGRVLLRLECAWGLKPVQDRLRLAYTHPRSRVKIPARILARRAGRWTVHGARVELEDLAGLVRISAYLPLEKHIKVWPARRSLAAARLPVARKRALLPSGATVANSAGQGFELRELRDYAPGDAFRRVDWKATARRRAVTVRDYEDEVVLSAFLAIDMSSTMRGGRAGSKFENTLDLAFDLVHAFALRGDRLGVVSFDDSVYGTLPIKSGVRQYRNAGEHLLALNSVYAHGYTEASEADVIEAVCDYLLVHERLDFRRRRKSLFGIEEEFAPTTELFDVALLERWIRARIEKEATPIERELMAAGIPVKDDIYRRFARARGLELPYRAESRLGRKAYGLAAALDTALSGLRGGGVVVLVTDLSGVGDLEPVISKLALAAIKRTRVLFAVPFTPDYVSPPPGAVGNLVFDSFAYGEQADRGRIARELAAAGAATLFVAPGESARRVLSLASHAPRRR
jgi:uncharacterized protein (DUF58 family)